MTPGVTQHLQKKQGRWFLASESTVSSKQPGQRAAPTCPVPPVPSRVKARAPGAEPTVQQAHQREQNWRITAGYLSNWVFRLSINDEWLPRRRPCHISSPEDSGKLHQCCKELDWKGRGFSLPACRRPDPGALSDGAE